MNNWIFLALLAPFIYSFVNFIDKYIVEKKVKDSRGMPVYGSIVALVFGTIVWLVSGSPLLSLRDGLIILMTGIFSMYGLALYFKALSKSETSLVIVLFQMTPVLTLILSYFILNEGISMKQFAGFVAVLISVIGLTLKKDSQGFRFTQEFYLILIADILFAVSAVLVKFAINVNSFVSVLSYESWGLFLGGLTLYLAFPAIRNAFWESNRTVGKSVLAIMFFNESLFVISKSLTFLAFSLGPVALVGVMGGTQVFYGILIGWLLTYLLPNIFSEDVSRDGLFRKVIFSSILFFGIYLIQ